MDLKTVEKIAKLARLELKKEEAENLTKELGGIFKWIEQLGEVNTDGSSEFSDDGETLRSRKDEITEGDRRADILANAPASEFDCFVVPKVIE